MARQAADHSESTTSNRPASNRPASQAQSNGKASTLALIGVASTTVANFVLAYLVSRPGAAAAGVFFVTISIITILGNSSCLGTMTGLVYFMPRVRTDTVDNPASLLFLALRPIVVFGVGAAVAIGLAAPFIGRVVADDGASDVATMLRLLAVTIPAWGLTVTMLGASRALGSMSPTAIIGQIIRPVGQVLGVGVVGFGSEEPSAGALAVAWGLPVLLAAVLSVSAVARLGGFHRVGSASVSSKEFWTYVRPRSVSTALQIALERLDVILVSALAPQAGISGEVASGIYGVLSRFITAGNFLVAGLAQAVAPNIRRAIAAKNRVRAQKLIDQTTGWMVLLVWPYLLLLALHPKAVIGIINPDFADGATALTILGLGILVSPAVGPADSALLMLGRSGWSLVAATAAIAVNGSLAFILIPRFGIEGAAVAWFCAVATQNILAFLLVHRFGGFRFSPGRPALVAGVGALLSVAPIGLITPDTFVGLVLAGVVSALILAGWALWQSTELSLPSAVSDRVQQFRRSS